jgi:hypothetical protein
MFEVPLPSLEELHADAGMFQTLLDSGILAPEAQVVAANHLRGLNNSITFIEAMGLR